MDYILISMKAKKKVSMREQADMVMRTAITSDADFYTRVLNYEAIDIDEFQARVQTRGLRIGIHRLVNFLDSQAWHTRLCTSENLNT